MNEFEKEYYESPDFWNDGAVNDSANLKRVQSTIDLIPSDVKSLADIGCGNGAFLNQLLTQNKNINLIGVDRSKEALKYVHCHSKLGDITDVPIESNSYDCVSCLQVLEHIPVRDYSKALDELARVSKKYIIIGVPFEEKIEQNITTCPQCKTIFNIDLHLRSYNMEDVKNLFKSQNFDFRKHINVIETKEYLLLKYMSQFRSWFKPINKKEIFRSPLCPLCGFENKTPEFFKPTVIKHHKNESKIKNLIAKSIKFLSPTRMKKGYWIMALYEKNN